MYWFFLVQSLYGITLLDISLWQCSLQDKITQFCTLEKTSLIHYHVHPPLCGKPQAIYTVCLDSYPSHTIPSERHLIGPKFILQQCNNPKHAARVIKNYLQWQEQMVEPAALVSTLWSLSRITWRDRRHRESLRSQENCGTFSDMLPTAYLPSKTCAWASRGPVLFSGQRVVTLNIHLVCIL